MKNIIILFLLVASAFSTISISFDGRQVELVEKYIDLIKVYYHFRHVTVLTHFSCFTKAINAYIGTTLSNSSFQSRFITNFTQILRLVDTPHQSNEGYIVNVACEGFRNIFLQDDHKVIFKNNNLWLFINPDENIDGDILMDDQAWLITLDMLPVSDVIYAIPNTNNKWNSTIDWIFFDIYKIAPNFPLEISIFAFIYNSNAVEIDEYDCPWKWAWQRVSVTPKFQSKSTRDDLKGLQLRCGLVIAYPERFTYLEDTKVEHVDIFTKGTATVAANMRENLNMSCDIVQVDNYGWNINGTFNGAMGLFQQKRIQILSHATIMREDRLKYVEFTGEVFVVETPIIFRQPPLSAIANIFILPLEVEVWNCCIAIMIVAIGIMFSQMAHSVIRNQMTAFDIVSFVWGAVCQQGTHLNIPTTSGRFIVLTIFLATLAIFTSYSASIVALLQSPSHLIRNIDDLLASPLKMSLQEAGYNRYNYLVENISILQKVYDKKIRPMGADGWVYDPFVGVEKIRTELFAFQVEAATAYKAVAETYTESEKCSLSEIHVLRLAVTTVTVERNSPYKELFRRRLRWQRENGLMNNRKRRWFPKKPICEGGARGFQTVGLQEVKPALQLLAIGTGVSLVLMIFEFIVHFVTLRYQNKRLEPRFKKTQLFPQMLKIKH